MTMRSPRAFMAASSGSGSFPAGGCSRVPPPRAGRCRSGGSSRRARRRRGRAARTGRARRSRRRGRPARAGPRARFGVARREGARERERRARGRRAPGSALRDESASPSASRTVGTTRISSPRARSPTIRRTHLDLLGVLLAEVRAVGADDDEELQADGGDAAEVPGPEAALEHLRELLDVDPGREARRVHLLRGRREDDVHARFLGAARRSRSSSRGYRAEVVAAVELGRVDEDARDDDVVLCARCARAARGGPRGGRPSWARGRRDPSAAGAGSAAGPPRSCARPSRPRSPLRGSGTAAPAPAPARASARSWRLARSPSRRARSARSSGSRCRSSAA